MYVIKVYSYENGRAAGLLEDLYRGEAVSFNGFDEAILSVNRRMVREESEPGASLRVPVLPRHVPEDNRREAEKAGRGVMAVFSIRILYQYYHSWQGEMYWFRHRRVCFRSVLELLELLKEAMEEVSDTQNKIT